MSIPPAASFTTASIVSKKLISLLMLSPKLDIDTALSEIPLFSDRHLRDDFINFLSARQFYTQKQIMEFFESLQPRILTLQTTHKRGELLAKLRRIARSAMAQELAFDRKELV